MVVADARRRVTRLRRSRAPRLRAVRDRRCRCSCTTPDDANELPADPITPVDARRPTTSRCCCSPRAPPGAPKPAMLTHGSLLANLEQMQAHPGLRVHGDDVALAVLPLFHVYGLNVVLGLALHGRARRVARRPLPSERDARARARRRRHRRRRRCPRSSRRGSALDAAAAPADAFARVRLCVSGAAPLRVDARRTRCATRFGGRRARRLRAHRGVAGRHHERGRGEAAVGLGRAAVAGRRGAARRRRRPRRARAAIPARSSCAAPTCSRATGATPTTTARVLDATAGCTPATSASPTPTAGSRSSSAPRTS